METVIGGTEQRFCLRSENREKSDLAKSFMSPLKIWKLCGPESASHPRAKMLSPSMSSMTLTSQTDEEITPLTAQDIANKYSLSADQLIDIDLLNLEALPGISDGEVQMLTDWRDQLLEQKRAEDIRNLVDDNFHYQDNFFKKN